VAYKCGTCQSRVLTARVADRKRTDTQWQWELMCGNGHVWVPVPGTEITIAPREPEA
jgi:hypothetical protein